MRSLQRSPKLLHFFEKNLKWINKLAIRIPHILLTEADQSGPSKPVVKSCHAVACKLNDRQAKLFWFELANFGAVGSWCFSVSQGNWTSDRRSPRPYSIVEVADDATEPEPAAPLGQRPMMVTTVSADIPLEELFSGLLRLPGHRVLYPNTYQQQVQLRQPLCPPQTRDSLTPPAKIDPQRLSLPPSVGLNFGPLEKC